MNLFRLLMVMTSLFLTGVCQAQTDVPLSNRELVHQIENLQIRTTELEQQVETAAGIFLIYPSPMLLFLSAAFCALWAQNTGRNAWLWFFLGGLLPGIGILFALLRNSEDNQLKRIFKSARPRDLS